MNNNRYSHGYSDYRNLYVPSNHEYIKRKRSLLSYLPDIDTIKLWLAMVGMVLCFAIAAYAASMNGGSGARSKIWVPIKIGNVFTFIPF